MTVGTCRAAVAVAVLVGALTLTACGAEQKSGAKQPAGEDPVTLTVYNGQHEELAQALTTAFTKETGIRVELRTGEGADLANQIREEGDRTRADVLLTEDPGPAAMLDQAGLLAGVDDATLDGVDRRLVPSSGNWAPYAARARVILYNPELISARELPDSILELGDPRWKGKFAYAPSGAFAATTAYLISKIGPEKTLAWLKAIRANGVNEQKNGKVRDTVEAGQHAFGLSNHYYWWILAGERGGPEKLSSKVHYFPKPDAGGLLLASAAAIPQSAEHRDEAQRFLAWLTAPGGGQKLIASSPDAQYPVAEGITSKVGLPPLSEVRAPRIDGSEFGDVAKAQELLIEAGLV
jgi:iron(III) transport system substrate-binding protein